MYTHETVHTRFPDTLDSNADHFVCVLVDGANWVYDGNSDDNPESRWFTPVSTDVLVATVDFGADTVVMAVGMDQDIQTPGTDGVPPLSVHLGYESGDINVVPNVWNGAANSGEFGVSGSHFITTDGADQSCVVGDGFVAIADVNSGIACDDGMADHGYIMYSEESVHTRFPETHDNQANNFLCVVYDEDTSQWMYDPNGTPLAMGEPLDTDLLVAIFRPILNRIV